MLVFFAAMPWTFLDLGWIVYTVESVVDINVFSALLGAVVSVASVRYLAFGVAFVIGLWGTRWRPEGWSAVWLGLLVYSLWAAVSVLWSVSPVLGAVKAFCLIGSVLVARALVSRAGGLARLVRCTIGAGIVVIGAAIVVAIVVPGYGLDPYGDWYPRLGGQLIHPNELAECVGVIMILALGWPGGWQPRTRWGAAALCAAVVLATQSRTTMLALVAAGGVWLLIRTGPAIRALTVGLGALAILVIGVSGLDVQGMLGYLGRGSSAEIGDTIIQRVELWEYGLQQSFGSLLIGQGFAVGSRTVLGPAFWWHPFHAHNLALEILLNLGVVGVLLAGLTVVLTVRSLVRLVRCGGDWSRRGAVGLTLLTFIIALGATERSFGGELSSAVMGFVLTIAIASIQRGDPSSVADHPEMALDKATRDHTPLTAPA
jgi:O-antigen ligase